MWQMYLLVYLLWQRKFRHLMPHCLCQNSVQYSCSLLSLTEDQRDIIAKDTHRQSENKKCSEYRRGVTTASRILDVVRKIYDGSISNQAPADNLVAAMLDYKKKVSTKAMKWGVINEPYIREQYKREMKKEHTHTLLSVRN